MSSQVIALLATSHSHTPIAATLVASERRSVSRQKILFELFALGDVVRDANVSGDFPLMIEYGVDENVGDQPRAVLADKGPFAFFGLAVARFFDESRVAFDRPPVDRAQFLKPRASISDAK